MRREMEAAREDHISDEDLAQVEEIGRKKAEITSEIKKVIVGQDKVIEEILIALFCRGHCLLVGVPGLAKTLLISTLAGIMELDFNRVQFTSDLMPSDITGTDILEEEVGSKRRSFRFVKGPIFTNILLADEINRTPPKTQAALLQAMQEYKVTAGGMTYPLDLPFFVLATQNPIEQEGTYPLPEAQLDRFTARLSLGYPPLAEEALMLSEQTTAPPLDRLEAVADRTEVLAAIAAAREIYVDESVGEYVVRLLQHTRSSHRLALGASPRAGIALLRMAKASAVAGGRDFVLPEDVQAVAAPVLAHRLILGPEARATGLAPEEAVEEALAEIPVPA